MYTNLDTSSLENGTTLYLLQNNHYCLMLSLPFMALKKDNNHKCEMH